MGERTQHTPGTFSWTDLNTTDQEAAKAFYSGLFGWEITDMPAGEGVMYARAAIDGKWVGAISPQPQQQREAGVPPAWNSYVTVTNVDETAAKAGELGATVHAPPFDVMDAGRMAVIQDPQGAWFLLWQPNQHMGAQLVNAPGALCWNELGTSDLDGSAKFYGDLLGWTTEPMEGGEMPYLVIKTADGHSNGGIRPPMPPGTPPFWLVYFATDDLDGTLAKVSELGGSVLMGNTDIGIARIGVAQDPQGAVFALYSGRLDD
ncbi:MAG: VOC family protein [Solirubrobacteraceae bacterium]